jgi:hypothetical protein
MSNALGMWFQGSLVQAVLLILVGVLATAHVASGRSPFKDRESDDYQLSICWELVGNTRGDTLIHERSLVPLNYVAATGKVEHRTCNNTLS